MGAEDAMFLLAKCSAQGPVDHKALVISALQRLVMVSESPGVRMAAALSLELLTGMGFGGRPITAKTSRNIRFLISATVLSRDMNQVLVRRHPRGDRLPRMVWDESDAWITKFPVQLARDVSGDHSAELALMGRPLSVELWDDDPDGIDIGLNFLAIARGVDATPQNSAWCFKNFSSLNLNQLDPREVLALSEMLTTMGIENPYDVQGEDDEKKPQMMHPAA